MTQSYSLLFLTLNRFHTFFWCFHCWFWTSKCQWGYWLNNFSCRLIPIIWVLGNTLTQPVAKSVFTISFSSDTLFCSDSPLPPQQYVFKWMESHYNLFSLKVTIMQIWKSANIFVFIWKWYVEDFTLKHLLLFEICARKICVKFVYKHSETIENVKN